MNMQRMSIAVVTLMVAATGSAMAAGNGWPGDGSNKVGVAAGLDLEYGGDDVVKVTYRNGDTQTLHAGQGAAFNAGVHFRPAGGIVDLIGTVGYKYESATARNADIHIDRVVFKVLGEVDLPHSFWIGAGPIWHTNIHFNGDGFTPDVNFGDAVGVSGLVGWRWVALTYTNMSYKAQSPYSGKVDASSFGLSLTWRG